jgi:hypothetical protein
MSTQSRKQQNPHCFLTLQALYKHIIRCTLFDYIIITTISLCKVNSRYDHGYSLPLRRDGNLCFRHSLLSRHKHLPQTTRHSEKSTPIYEAQEQDAYMDRNKSRYDCQCFPSLQRHDHQCLSPHQRHDNQCLSPHRKHDHLYYSFSLCSHPEDLHCTRWCHGISALVHGDRGQEAQNAAAVRLSHTQKALVFYQSIFTQAILTINLVIVFWKQYTYCNPFARAI